MKSIILHNNVITVVASNGSYAVDFQRYHGDNPIYSVTSPYRGTAATLSSLINLRKLRRFEQRFVVSAM